MHFRKNTLYILLLMSFGFFSCVFGELTFTDSKNWVPRDFHPKAETLLIEQYPDENVNEEMVDYLKKNYRGQYEVVDRQMILSKTGKYADTDLYQFAFLWETKESDTKPIGHFLDRVQNLHYPSTIKTNRYQAKNAYRSYINTIDLLYKKKY